MSSITWCARVTVLATVGGAGAGTFQAMPQTSPVLPTIRSVRPDVVLSGTPTAQITIRGTSLAKITAVKIMDCDGKSFSTKVNHATTVTADLPASVLGQPCVLRVATEENPVVSVPLAMADAELAKLTLPAYDPDHYYAWSGQFN